MSARSATRIEEKELVRRFFLGDPAVDYMLGFIFGEPPYHRACEVGTPVLDRANRRTGELDLLIWSPRSPSRAVALEAKRARVDETKLVTEQIGGLRALREGAAQVNAHLQRGFAEVYLALFIAVDARTSSGGDWLGGRLPRALREMALSAVAQSGLHSDAGFVVFELSQPIDKDAVDAGGFGLLASRPARPRIQSEEITRRVKAFFQSA